MSGPLPGDIMGLTLGTGPQKGDAWTGFEWVTPERYETLRATSMPSLPPLQDTPKGVLPLPAPTMADMQRAARIAEHAVATVITPSQRDGYPDRMRMEEAFAMILESVDPDPDRGGLDETPVRAAKAWEFWTSGYAQDPATVLKVFTDGAEGCDEMVVVHDIPIYSKCEHHLADIVGTCTVGYLPNGKIVGLSKIPRLVNIFARRLQVQERMTNQIANAMMEHLAPHGVGVVIKARHMCMESRGIQQRSTTTTSALRGVFKEDPTVREEFLTLAHKGD